jgi:hypothetical protein
MVIPVQYIWAAALRECLRKLLLCLEKRGLSYPNNAIYGFVKATPTKLPVTVQNFVDSLGSFKKGETTSYPNVNVLDCIRIAREIVTLVGNPQALGAYNHDRTRDLLDSNMDEAMLAVFNGINANANHQLNGTTSLDFYHNHVHRNIHGANALLADANAYTAILNAGTACTHANVLSEFNGFPVNAIVTTAFHTQNAFRRNVFAPNPWNDFFNVNFLPYYTFISLSKFTYSDSKEANTLGSPCQILNITATSESNIDIKSTEPLNLSLSCDAIFFRSVKMTTLSYTAHFSGLSTKKVLTDVLDSTRKKFKES